MTSSTASTQLQVTSTSTGSKPDLRTKLSVKTQDLSPAKQVEESVIIQVTSKETSPVATEMDIDTPEPVAEARQREGLAPQTKAPSDEQTNSLI